MVAQLVLARAERRRIQKLDRKTRDGDVRVRCRVVLKVASGASRRRAAQDVGCVPSTAWQIVTRYLQKGEGSLIDGRCDNGTLKVDEDVRGWIEQVLAGTPQDHGYPRPTWTLELLSRVVQEGLDLEVSCGHLSKLLHRWGIRRGPSKPIVLCPWKRARRQRRLRQLRTLARDPGPKEVVVFADEVDLHLNPKIGLDWQLPGQQRRIVTPGQNKKAYAAGAFDPRRNRMVYVEGDRKVAWLFLNLLRALLEAYWWARRIHVILDNYKIHKSRVVEQAMKALGDKISLHFLPPYCPDDNKIERVWRDVHGNVTRNHRERTLAALLHNVREYLATRFDLWVGRLVHV
jgi:transposase